MDFVCPDLAIHNDVSDVHRKEISVAFALCSPLLAGTLKDVTFLQFSLPGPPTCTNWI